MKTAIRSLLLALLFLATGAPYTNPGAQVGIHNSGASTICKGCAFVLAGGVTRGLLNVTRPAGADSSFAGVVADLDIATGADGSGYQLGLSNIQLKLASNVQADDMVHIANALGEFEKAPANSQFVAYQVATNGAAGSSTTWGVPIAPRPIVQTRFLSSVLTGNGALQSTPHGLAGVPSCRAWIVSLPAALSLAVATGIIPGTHDGTNCIFGVTTGIKYQIEANF